METATAATGIVLTRLANLPSTKEDEKREDAVDLLNLKAELTSLHAALRELADVPPDQLDGHAKAWAGDARDLAYDVDDAIDNNAFAARAEGGIFKNLLERATDLSRTRPTAAVGDVIRRPVAGVDADPTEGKGSGGLDAARDDLIKKLCAGDGDGGEASEGRGLRVVAVVGSAGLGKTTLAKMVYDTLKPRFDCGAFVSVSVNPDMAVVFRRMLRQLDDGRNARVGCSEEPKDDEGQIVDQLREFLRDRRYLIVIDDIWEKPSWEMIKHVLVENYCGSRIITTTRNFSLADQVGIPYELKPLSLDNSKILFLQRVFGHDNKSCLDDEFSEVADKIIDKCDGVPIGILAVASLLADKIGNKKEWYKVLDSIGSTLENNPDVKNMRNAISLGYYCLPVNLRACLLYLSIFPENYEVRRDRLIWRWIAEGFIHGGNQGESLFEIGESYFNELVSRSMVQLLDIDYSADGIREEYCCRVNFSVMDLISSLSSEENFVTILNNEQQTCPSNKVCRLSIRGSKEAIDTANQATLNMFQVRSLSVFSPAIGSINNLSQFKVLHVLDLEGCDLSESQHVLNNQFGSFLHLRYLGLRDTRITEVQDIGKLQFLQTLDLADTRIEELPATVFRLGKLMSLNVQYRTKIPRGIGNVVSLEELSDISTHDSPDLVKELRNLTKLRVLKITLYQPTQSTEEALVESLQNLNKLQDLHIYTASGNGHKKLLDLLQDGTWTPPQRLRSFGAKGTYISCSPLRLLPLWINTSVVPHLTVLLIQVMELRQVDVDVLGELPVLETLLVEPYEMKESIVIGSGAFPCLKECRFRNSDLGPVIREGAMPRLRIIEFCFGVRQTKDLGNGFEFGLANLGCLQEATVYIKCHDATEPEAEEAEVAMRRAADTHPNHANFDMNTFGEELMRFDDDD
uniref:AAA+ ATPase domain-containing protein n=1 Tax=Leersia perrieri TaxID=77586 RepID=A0A0D9V0Q2_9ORYZ